MPLSARVIFFGLTGIIAGVVAWPFSEALIHYQASFPSLMVYNITIGVAVGLFMGAVFGTSEGIISMSRAKARGGIIAGLIIGTAGGLAGFMAGQYVMLSLGTSFFNSTGAFQRYGVPLSRAVGWAVFGVFIGVAEGIRSLSGAKVRNGVIGGFCGGLVGGLAVEYMRVFAPRNIYARLIGLAALGFCIGVFYGFIEIRLAKASLLLLSGKLKGREFPLTQRFTRVGGSDKTEVGIVGYKGVDDVHVEIRKEKGEFVLTDAGSKTGTFVNDEKVKKTILNEGDVIRTGDASFQFGKR